MRNRRTVSYEESKAYYIDIHKIESDGRTTIMVRNIPNKYTQDMLLELFEKNHKKKFDFFYLPIDYNVNFISFRIIAMSDMPFLILYIQNLLVISIKNFMNKNGINSIQLKFAKFAMQGFKEQLNFKIIFSIQMFCNNVKKNTVH
jgi:hypothetical protein